jgi:hypothetical protein
MPRKLLVLVGASAVYGFSLGSAHCPLYATRNLIKLPLLIVGTAALCGIACFIVGRFASVRLSFARTQTLVVDALRDTAILLVSLSPANYFIARILVHTDDARLGEYSLFLGLNIAFIALSGTLALVRQARRLLAACAISPRRATGVVLSWLVLMLLVGGQLAFYLRPFFGLPASRGVTPPFALGAAPDVRGATNFYEVVIQVFTAPPLPRGWD